MVTANQTPAIGNHIWGREVQGVQRLMAGCYTDAFFYDGAGDSASAGDTTTALASGPSLFDAVPHLLSHDHDCCAAQEYTP
jgi:hypothetical protein